MSHCCKTTELKPHMRAARVLLACVLSVSFSLCAYPNAASTAAYADVRTSDVLAGISIESRGISAALCPSIDAECAILVNDKGDVYFERNADNECHIASVTKIMTAIVALEYAPLDTVVTVNAEAARIGESSAGLQDGDTMTLEQALNGLLVSSGNDAAIAIADTLGAMMKERGSLDPVSAQSAPAEGEGSSAGAAESVDTQSFDGVGNVEVFVMAMNQKANDLGMSHTLFANPHGLDVGTYEQDMYSSARDVAVMAAYAMGVDTFRSIVSQSGATISVTRADGTIAPIELKSTDKLIGVYDGACGIKTGYTEAAGYCFAGACNRNGEDLFAVVLGSSSEAQRFEDAKALYEWYYGNWCNYPLANSDVTVVANIDGADKEVPVVAEVSHKSWLNKTVKATLADPDASLRLFAFDGNVSQEVSFDDVKGDVKMGDKVGTITYYQHNEAIAACDMVAAESVAAPGAFETLKIAWQRFWLGVRGESDCAESVVLNTTPLIYDKNVVTIS